MQRRKPYIIKTEVYRVYIYHKDPRAADFLFDGDYDECKETD